jgi:Cdc6-like AAA superfamily ATPase
MPTESGTIATSDRRQLFRAFMKRFNPTAPARSAIGEGLICQDSGRSVFRKLAARADLAIGSQQLVVGGIGSGKTTELLLAERELSAHEELLAVYVDVSAETDLSAVNSGVLLACLGVRLWDTLVSKFGPPEALSGVYDAIQKAAYGHERLVLGIEKMTDFTLGGLFHSVSVPGKLATPFPAIQRDVKDLAESLSKLTSFLKEKGRELVAIFDGLDRLIKADQFWSVAEQDLRALRPLEISVLAAGPLSIMYGQGRQIKDYFDEAYYLPAAVADPKLSSFLLEILRIRGAEELMRPERMQRICQASGGVLRDLISLARNAGENAYLDDANKIEAQHVARAVEQLGNSYLLGLGTRQTTILRNMLAGEGFNPSDSDSMELLVSRRVLEQSESRYEVHPALASVLQQIPDAPE